MTYKDRDLYNDEILMILADYLRDNPEQRFNQALVNLGLVEHGLVHFRTDSQGVYYIDYNQESGHTLRLLKLKLEETANET